uniref:Ketoreductase (KR) domain-containing protein n=1 Tax=Corethron hystrix TaxID=216773 RepID=A0A7S1BW92_9STRA|mmetsp:Transcript_4436/g.8626  ORF Transcript_4436/g.8626 Transcript_4436/m.8626 type:complete len:238 (+) Transcript_4436:23-736(+)
MTTEFAVSKNTGGFSLIDRSFIVTGGTKGIGYATVRNLLSCGASTVVICSRTADDVRRVVSTLNDEFPSIDNAPTQRKRAYGVPCDVSTEPGRNELLRFVTEEIFPESSKKSFELDGLINNAGMNIRKPISEQTSGEYQNILRTNIDSVYFLCKMFHPILKRSSSAQMAARGRGSFSCGGATIVNVSSAAGVQSSGTGAAYGAAKAAIVSFTRSAGESFILIFFSQVDCHFYSSFLE